LKKKSQEDFLAGGSQSDFDDISGSDKNSDSDDVDQATFDGTATADTKNNSVKHS